MQGAGQLPGQQSLELQRSKSCCARWMLTAAICRLPLRLPALLWEAGIDDLRASDFFRHEYLGATLAGPLKRPGNLFVMGVGSHHNVNRLGRVELDLEPVFQAAEGGYRVTPGQQKLGDEPGVRFDFDVGRLAGLPQRLEDLGPNTSPVLTDVEQPFTPCTEGHGHELAACSQARVARG